MKYTSFFWLIRLTDEMVQGYVDEQGIDRDVKPVVYGYTRYIKLLKVIINAIDNGKICFYGYGCSPENSIQLVNYLRYRTRDNPEPITEYIRSSLAYFNLSTLEMKASYSKYEHEYLSH